MEKNIVKKFIIELTFPMPMDDEVIERVNRIIKEVAKAKLNPAIKVEVTIVE